MSLLRSLLLVAGLAGAARGNVLVVGPGGFPTIQSAVDAAIDGDVILLPSEY